MREFTFRLLILAALELALDKLKVDNVLESDVANDKHQLGELEGTNLVLGGFLWQDSLALGGGDVCHLCSINRRRRLGRRLSRLLSRLGLGSSLDSGSLGEDPRSEILDDLTTESIGLLAKQVDGVDRLLSHAKPLRRTRRVLDDVLELDEYRVVHGQAHGLVGKRALDLLGTATKTLKGNASVASQDKVVLYMSACAPKDELNSPCHEGQVQS